MPDMTPDELARVGLRYETTSEHIARDMREGRFPERSDRQVVALTPAPVAQDVAGLIERLEEVWADENNGALCREAAAALRAQTADAGAQPQDGNRPLPIDRETLGRMVREAWVRWAETQPAPKPSWLVPYDELAEPDKEADRQIGEAIARWTLIHDAARNSLAADAGAQGEAVTLPKLTNAMIWAACEGHYGKRLVAKTGGPDGIVMTVDGTDWSFRQAMRRMWAGMKRAPVAPLADPVREAARVRSEAIREFCDKAGIRPLQEVKGLPDDVKRWRMERAVAARRAEKDALAAPEGDSK